MRKPADLGVEFALIQLQPLPGAGRPADVSDRTACRMGMSGSWDVLLESPPWRFTAC